MPLSNLSASSSRASVNTQPGPTQRTRSPTDATLAPSYTPNASRTRTTHNNSIRSRNESFTMLAAPLRSGSSIATMDSTSLESESSITDMLGIEDTLAEMLRLEGPRYSEPNCIDCWNLLSYPVFQSTTAYTPQMGQPSRQILQLMIGIWAVSQLKASHRLTQCSLSNVAYQAANISNTIHALGCSSPFRIRARWRKIVLYQFLHPMAQVLHRKNPWL
jgi:hypothetical protein